MDRSQRKDYVVRLQVSVHEVEIVELLYSFTDLVQDLAEVAVLSLFFKEVSKVHLEPLHCKGHMSCAYQNLHQLSQVLRVRLLSLTENSVFVLHLQDLVLILMHVLVVEDLVDETVLIDDALALVPEYVEMALLSTLHGKEFQDRYLILPVEDDRGDAFVEKEERLSLLVPKLLCYRTDNFFLLGDSFCVVDDWLYWYLVLCDFFF